MKVWVGNLPPEATADEVKQRLVKHGFPECIAMQPVPGAGTRPGMAVEFEGVPAEGIRPFIQRMDGLCWKSRKLVVTIA